MNIKYFKWPKNRPKIHKIDRHRQLPDPSKLTQIAIFGLKIYRLATLLQLPKNS
jgi:hypothetical protein